MAAAEETQTETRDPSLTPAPAFFWVKDGQGYPSVTVTLLVYSFAATLLAYTCSIVETLGPLKFRPFDTAACMAFLGSTMALYGTRKYTTAKFSAPAPAPLPAAPAVVAAGDVNMNLPGA